MGRGSCPSSVGPMGKGSCLSSLGVPPPHVSVPHWRPLRITCPSLTACRSSLGVFHTDRRPSLRAPSSLAVPHCTRVPGRGYPLSLPLDVPPSLAVSRCKQAPGRGCHVEASSKGWMPAALATPPTTLGGSGRSCPSPSFLLALLLPLYLLFFFLCSCPSPSTVLVLLLPHFLPSPSSVLALLPLYLPFSFLCTCSSPPF